jgi:hypothetical protein
MTREPRRINVLIDEDPELRSARDAVRAAAAATRAPGGRRRYGAVHELYPRAACVTDCGLVGRAELIDMVGMDATAGANWYAWWISHGQFPPADGQTIDGRPTWRRRTMVRFLYLAARANGERYLRPELWAEAEAILDEDEAR